MRNMDLVLLCNIFCWDKQETNLNFLVNTQSLLYFIKVQKENPDSHKY